MSITYIGTYGIVSDVPVKTDGAGGIVAILPTEELLLSRFDTQEAAELAIKKAGEEIRQKAGGVTIIVIDDFRS